MLQNEIEFQQQYQIKTAFVFRKQETGNRKQETGLIYR